MTTWTEYTSIVYCLVSSRLLVRSHFILRRTLFHFRHLWLIANWCTRLSLEELLDAMAGRSRGRNGNGRFHSSNPREYIIIVQIYILRFYGVLVLIKILWPKKNLANLIFTPNVLTVFVHLPCCDTFLATPLVPIWLYNIIYFITMWIASYLSIFIWHGFSPSNFHQRKFVIFVFLKKYIHRWDQGYDGYLSCAYFFDFFSVILICFSLAIMETDVCALADYD